MKRTNFFNRILLLTSAMILAVGSHAQTSFNSLEFKGSSSAKPRTSGQIDFTDKNFTLELWLNIATENITVGQHILNTRTDGNTGFTLSFENVKISDDITEGRFRFFIKNTTEAGTHKDAFTLSIPPEKSLDKWVHLAFVISSEDKTLSSYINGEFNESVNIITDWVGNNSNYLRIGWYDWNALYLNGQMADLRIWSTARSAEQIKANYNKYLEGEQTGLYLNYTFHNGLYENYKPIINDANPGTNNTTNINDITLYGKVALVQMPLNVSVSGDNTLSWNAANATDTYEVQIIDETGTEVSTTPVTTTSLSLNDLVPFDGIYTAKVRTKSFINSDELFVYSRWTSEIQFVGSSSIDLNATGNFKAWTMFEGQAGGNGGKITFPGETAPSARNLTLEFWINMAENILNDGNVIATTSGDGNTGFAATVRTNSTNGNKPELRLWAKTPAGAAAIAIFVSSENYINKWAHIAFVISEADNKAYVYLNGEYYAETTATGGWYGNNTNTALLMGSAWSSPKFYGSLADFRVWSVARTAAQVKENYANLLDDPTQEAGLHINYTFSEWTGGNSVINTANPGTNDLTLSGNNQFRTVLSAIPTSIAFADNTLSWSITDGEWEVTIFKEEDDSEVLTDMFTENSIELDELDALAIGTGYYAKVRTLNNGFWSGQITSDVFTITDPANGINENKAQTAFRVSNGSLIVNAESPRILNIYAVGGQLIRSAYIVAGENVIKDLPKGFYLADNQKIVIR